MGCVRYSTLIDTSTYRRLRTNSLACPDEAVPRQFVALICRSLQDSG